MENIILRQHSPIVVLRNSEKNERKEISYAKSKTSGIGWIVAGVVVLIVIIYVIISSLKKDS